MNTYKFLLSAFDEKKRKKSESQGQNTEDIAMLFPPQNSLPGRKRIRTQQTKNKNSYEKNLIIPLNPQAQKGRLYIRINVYDLKQNAEYKDWDLVGWIISSPKQRTIVLKTIALDSVKRTPEAIRYRASRLNECLSRISTKEI